MPWDAFGSYITDGIYPHACYSTLQGKHPLQMTPVPLGPRVGTTLYVCTLYNVCLHMCPPVHNCIYTAYLRSHCYCPDITGRIAFVQAHTYIFQYMLLFFTNTHVFVQYIIISGFILRVCVCARAHTGCKCICTLTSAPRPAPPLRQPAHPSRVCWRATRWRHCAPPCARRRVSRAWRAPCCPTAHSSHWTW